MNKTTNYQLNQWEAIDQVRRTDFNEDNAKIDAAIKAEADARAAGDAALQTAVAGKADAGTVAELAASQLRLVTGSYVGTGEHGPEHPNTITFPFPPVVVGIVANRDSGGEQGTVFIRGQTASCGIGGCSSSGGALKITLAWNENSVTWSSSTPYAEDQLNSQSIRYYYFALG